MIKRLHHINFMFKDLQAAAGKFSTLFDAPVPETEYLTARGVKLVRFRVGDIWVILVQPTDPDGVPGRWLAERGEGVFLVSFEATSIEASLDRLAQAGITALDAEPREGLDGWKITELEMDPFGGVLIQLLESADG
jgi:methylmalonyl-CoA/ethylmalonyl-CoA epimerase